MYLLRGILPWQNMKAKDTKAKYKMIMEKKISTPAEFLCKGFPNELALFINYAKGLKFQEKPDYKYLKHLLATARKNNKIEMDYVYDWSNKLSSHNVALDVPKAQEKVQKKVETKIETKIEHVKNRKEDAINQALNTFQLNSTLTKTVQVSQNGTRKDTKSQNKGSQGVKNTNNILSSVGL